MRDAGLLYFEKIVSDLKPKNVHKIATILHPGLKGLQIVPIDERIEAYKIIDSEIRKFAPDDSEDSDAIATKTTNEFSLDFLHLILLSK